MESFFQDKRALVTGAGKGIGRDIAVTLYKRGAKTVALSRTQADLDSLEKECPGIQTVNQDLADWTSTREAISKLGPFDLLVNNAGILLMEPFLDIKQKDLDNVFDINFKAVFNISQVVARGMVEQGTGGAIVNMSSISAMTSYCAGQSAYCASKGAIDSLTQALALELGPHKIRVNAVNPGVTLTKMVEKLIEGETGTWMMQRTSVGRFGEVSDITNAVLFLLSDQSAMVTGTTLVVDGGFTQR